MCLGHCHRSCSWDCHKWLSEKWQPETIWRFFSLFPPKPQRETKGNPDCLNIAVWAENCHHFPAMPSLKPWGCNRTVRVWVKSRRSGLKDHSSLFQVYIESGKETPPASVSSSVDGVSNSNSPFARTQCYTVHESALWPAKCCRNMRSWYPLLCASLWVSLSECEDSQGCACCLALSAVLPWPLVLAWPLALQTPSQLLHLASVCALNPNYFAL